ncbi:hypothetical protein F4677DRAFT_443442 [Hypoxylon crocopeplum]|nr:hypothetical protein F4677DRAFT_443442 [Hypoxylon crocopeplum]
MSQREPASRSASPRISRSPPVGGPSTSPTSHQSDPRRSGNQPAIPGPLESSSIPRTNGDLTQSLPQRGFGVRNILNPAETQPSPTGTASSAASGPLGGHLNLSPNQQSSTFESSPTVPRPFMFPGHGMTSQQQGNPAAGGQPPLGPPPADRGSPGPSHHALGTRRILTPRSPRVSAAGYIPPPQALNAPQSHYYAAPPSAQHRGFQAEHPTPGRHAHSPRLGGAQPLAPQFGRVHPSGTGPPTTLAPLTTPPPRSLSQPIASQFNAPGQEHQHQHQHLQGGSGPQMRSHAFGPSPPYPTAVPPSNRGFPPSLPMGDSRWSSMLGGSQSGHSSIRGMVGADGHAAMNVGGEPLIVPLDMYNGSKQADEKRQRNAGASARFRARKKDKEIQQGIRIQELESQNRELQKRQQEAEAERDRYRSDRDRLRDIVYRTPGISELAYQGPPSPLSTRSGGSFAERSPLAPNQSGLPMPSYGVADPMTGERATRRRRTDPQLEFSPSYAPTQTNLPSIPPPTHHTPLSQPGTPSAMARTSRLPPLRLDQPAGTPSTGPSTTSTPVQSFPPYKREPYETGWATRPSAPHDPGQR